MLGLNSSLFVSRLFCCARTTGRLLVTVVEYVFLYFHLDSSGSAPSVAPRGSLSKRGVALQRVKEIMQDAGYYLFRGEVWFVHPQSVCTKVKFESAKGFVGHLCSNPNLQGDLFDHMAFLEKILGDPQCTVIEQLTLDVDVIEVSPYIVPILCSSDPNYAQFDYYFLSVTLAFLIVYSGSAEHGLLSPQATVHTLGSNTV